MMASNVKKLFELPASKAGITAFAKAVTTELMDSGDWNPLEIAVRVNAIEKIMKAIKADATFMDACFDEADLQPSKQFVYEGVTVTKTSSATLNYTADKTWLKLKAGETKAADERKRREAVLKTLKGKTNVEGKICYPPTKLSKDVLSFKF